MLKKDNNGKMCNAPPDCAVDDYAADDFTPAAIYRQLSDFVVGQENAKRACAIIFWQMFAHKKPRRSVSLFLGKSGSGKSMLWQTLSSLYPGTVICQDVSQITAEGWTGRSISDLLREHNAIGDRPVIVLLDEFCKICSKAIASGGTDHNRLIQNSLLTLLNGDDVDFGSGDKHINVHAKNISFVLCGAFTDLFDRQQQPEKRGIGFNATITEPETHNEITVDDLVQYGMLREIAGRISRIIQMDDPDVETMAEIGRKTALTMSLEYGTNITVAPDTLQDMAQKAIESGLGGRYMRTQIQARLDDLVYAHPFASHYIIGDEPEREKEKDCFA